MPQFEVGDEVTIVAGSEYDGREPDYNPAHGVIGEVIRSSAMSDQPIRVRWEHSGRNNSYRPEDLELVKGVIPRATRKSFRTWIAELNGEEVIPVETGVGLYPLPFDFNPSFNTFLQEYADTGGIDSDLLMSGFTWDTDPTLGGSWYLYHVGDRTLTDEHHAVLTSWCEQRGITANPVTCDANAPW